MSRYRQGYLDYLWHKFGTDHFKRLFAVMSQRNKHTLLRHVNDDRLSFPVFFILVKDIIKLGSFAELSPRNRAAVQICADKMTIPGWEEGSKAIYDNDVLHETLLWMFNTGKNWDGTGRDREEFDMMIDYAASLLVIMFDDRTVLPDIIDIIFRRNRKGFYIHDLVWGFFQTLDWETLALNAKRLLSEEQNDVELACRLLHLEPPAAIDRTVMQKQYEEYTQWLAENRPYLYLTGEHFQQLSNPTHFDCDIEAKYLGKEISPHSMMPIEPLSEPEVESLKNFRAVGDQERKMLADYSCKLRRRNMREWDEWMHKDITQQVIAAQTGYEVIR